jgi:hypothetical protein
MINIFDGKRSSLSGMKLPKDSMLWVRDDHFFIFLNETVLIPGSFRIQILNYSESLIVLVFQHQSFFQDFQKFVKKLFVTIALGGLYNKTFYSPNVSLACLLLSTASIHW